MSSGHTHYFSIGEPILSTNDPKEQIKLIDQTIAKLRAALYDAADNEAYVQYSLDDGQTSVSVGYRTTASIQKSIKALERDRNDILRRHYGSSLLRPARNILPRK